MSPLNFVRLESNPTDDCIICLNPLDRDVIGHGEHAFHIDCIAKWVRNNPCCPLCKAAMNADSVFKEQSFKDRSVQAILTYPYAETAFNLYLEAKPYLLRTTVFALIYTPPYLGIRNAEALCEVANSPLCSYLPIVKAGLLSVGGIIYIKNTFFAPEGSAEHMNQLYS